MSIRRPAADTVSLRQILELFLPLAVTSTMMSASVPIINAGLARMENSEANLAGFGVAFGLSILLESPVFALQQAVLAWYRGKGPFFHLVRFALYVGLVVMVVDAAVAFSPIAPYVLTEWMRVPPHIVDLAVGPLRVAVLFPPLIAVRSALQSLLVSRRKPGPIGWGTLGRLLCLAILVLVVTPRLPFPGPVSAMASLVAAVVVETIYVSFALVSAVPRAGRSSPAQEAGRTPGSRVKFLLPLAGMMILGTLSNPIINGFISRSQNPQQGLAVYAVVMSLAWFVASPFLRMSSVTIALGETGRHRLRILKVLTALVLPFSLALAGVQLVLWRPLLEGVMGLAPHLARMAHWPLVALSLLPAVAAYSAYFIGVLTRMDHTPAVSAGGLGRVFSILAAGSLGLSLGVASGYLGGMLLGIAFTGELIVVFLLTRKLVKGFADPLAES